MSKETRYLVPIALIPLFLLFSVMVGKVFGTGYGLILFGVSIITILVIAIFYARQEKE